MKKVGFWKTRFKRRKRIVRRVSWIVASVAAGLIVVQLALPYDRFLPLQKIDGVSVGLMTYTEAQDTLNKAYMEHEVDFRLGDRKIGEALVKDTGLNVDADRQIAKAQYSLRDRFIPGTIFYKMFYDAGNLPKISVNVEIANSYLERNYAQICAVAPVNASITVIDGRLKLNDDKGGLLCDENRFLGDMVAEDLTLTRPLVVKMSGKNIEALVMSYDLKEVFDKTRDQLVNGVVFAIDAEKNIAARYSDMVKWLNIESDVFGRVKISYSGDKIREYLINVIATLAKQTNGVTVVTELNGVEIGRKNGNTGRDLDYDKMVAVVQEHLQNGSSDKIAVLTVQTEPIVKYKRSFSKNFAGLLALFENRLRGTSDIIVVKDLSGRNMSQAIGEDEAFESRLATQLVVTFLMLHEEESGKVDGRCFDKLISEYDETCVRDFTSTMDATNLLRLNGLEKTSFNGEIVRTTASDMTKLMSYVSADSAGSSWVSKLLGKLKSEASGMNRDENDKLVTVRIVVEETGSSHTVVAATDDRARVKESLSFIEEIFKAE